MTFRKTKLTVTSATVDELLKLASDSRDEVCGLVVDNDIVHPIRNVADQPRHRWAMDPAEMSEVVKKYGHERITAIYHSHPSGPPHPSKEDEDGIRLWYRQGCPWGYLIVTRKRVSQFEYCKEERDGKVGAAHRSDERYHTRHSGRKR